MRGCTSKPGHAQAHRQSRTTTLGLGVTLSTSWGLTRCHRSLRRSAASLNLRLVPWPGLCCCCCVFVLRLGPRSPPGAGPLRGGGLSWLADTARSALRLKLQRKGMPSMLLLLVVTYTHRLLRKGAHGALLCISAAGQQERKQSALHVTDDSGCVVARIAARITLGSLHHTTTSSTRIKIQTDCRTTAYERVSRANVAKRETLDCHCHIAAAEPAPAWGSSILPQFLR